MTKDPTSSTENTDDNATPGDQKRNPRSSARLAAVQALYQMDLASTDVANVIEEFSKERFPNAQDDDPVKGADAYFFGELLRGVVRRQRDLDPLIDSRLAQGWRLSRIDSTLRAILRAGAFELIERNDVPAKVVINEYLNISHVFFDGEQPKVVNGVLDRLSKDCRSGEFAATTPSSEKG